MRLFPSIATCLAAAWLLAPLRAQDGNLAHARILAHLDNMRATQRGMMNVAHAEGEYLANLVKKLNAKRVLEIGTSNGYSGIWLALGLRETGGRLITLEVDKGRYSLAVKNFKATGMDDIIEARLGDALEEIPKLEGAFDLVFIDAWKPDYIKYLQMVLPKVPSGGVITAHNVHSHPHEMRDFLEEIKTNPALRTEFVHAGPAGISVSYKK